MKLGPDIAQLAALIGDPARANMLSALMTGSALTARELAEEAGITPQTASSHLMKLQDGGLLIQRRQGRHKYFTLAGDEVAQVLEGLMGLAARSGHLRFRPGPRNDALRRARVCYNHLAGEMGTALYASLTASGSIVLNGPAPSLSSSGVLWMSRFGIDVAALQQARAPLCRECLDWSERRPHLAGSLGRAVFARIQELGWAKRDRATRIVDFSRSGELQFRELLAKAADHHR